MLNSLFGTPGNRRHTAQLFNASAC
jgi:hypothetical protein